MLSVRISRDVLTRVCACVCVCVCVSVCLSVHFRLVIGTGGSRLDLGAQRKHKKQFATTLLSAPGTGIRNSPKRSPLCPSETEMHFRYRHRCEVEGIFFPTFCLPSQDQNNFSRAQKLPKDKDVTCTDMQAPVKTAAEPDSNECFMDATANWMELIKKFLTYLITVQQTLKFLKVERKTSVLPGKIKKVAAIQ